MPRRVLRFVRRRHWQEIVISLLVVGLGFVIGTQLIENAGNDEARRVERDRQTAQFCQAIPNAAEAGAQALVNILVANPDPGTTPAQIERTVRLGRLYVAEARRLALIDLPYCPKEP